MKAVPTIHCQVTLYVIKDWLILHLSDEASEQLPSRGQVAVTGTLNGHSFAAVLEPDGDWRHWLRIDDALQQATGVVVGDTVTLELSPHNDWPEPEIPQDLQKALNGASEKVQKLWKNITPMSRWEWARWVNATNNAQTRQRRVAASISKMEGGKRRPCCFNLAACTVPYVAKNGRLMEQAG